MPARPFSSPAPAAALAAALITTLIATLGASAVAQCGAAQYVTPPNFVADNGGDVGGFVYVSLDVTAPNGVRICGIAVHTSTVANQIGCRVEVHQSIGDWSQLSGTNNTGADWRTVACLSGAGRGPLLPSPLLVLNGTGSIDLPMGQHLLAIGGGNFDHDYTNGVGANQTGSAPGFTFTAGVAASTAYSGQLFGPRVANLVFDYDIATTPVTPSPGGQVCIESSHVVAGSGCGGVAVSAAEEFDMTNAWDFSDPALSITSDLVISGNSGSGSVSVATVPGGTAIVPPLTGPLGLQDDDVSALIPLGFDLGAFGLPCVDAIAVDSNGCIWLGDIGESDYSPTLGELATNRARLCAFWRDLRPVGGGGGGTIHADVSLGTDAVITFDRVFLWGTSTPVTLQVVIKPTQMVCRYDASSPFDESIVGFHNGTSGAGLVSADLSGGVGPFAPGGRNVGLVATRNPTLGGRFDLEIRDLPAGGLGAIVATIGPLGPPVLQPSPPFAPNCEGFIPATSPSLGVVVAADPCLRYPYGLAIPNNGVWLGLPFAAQAVAFDLSTGTIMLGPAIGTAIANY